MAAHARFAIGTIAALLVLAAAMLIQSQPSHGETKFVSLGSPIGAPPTTAAALPTTTTAAAPVATTTTLAPATTTTSAAPRVVVTRPAPVVTAAPRVVHSSGIESCGWGWDATRFDDGSLDEVIVTLNAPRRPGQAVTITAAPHGPTTPAAVRPVTLDGDGNASTTVRLTEDRRDWTVTVSATFPSGGTCDARTFTIAY